ncbi:hypothetical protein NMG60_11013718 [Bertholletia excelsa]
MAEESLSVNLSRRIGEFLNKEVTGWDDEVMTSARFKAFSGQRSDWESQYVFWRDLIFKVATYLGVFQFHPSEVKDVWFSRGGLTPLCLDHVLLEMRNAGDILRQGDLFDPTRGRLFQIFKRVINRMNLYRSSTQADIMEELLILLPLLKNKAAEVIKLIAENHWTSSCIITMKKFQDICGGSNESSAILSYLSEERKAQYLAINKREIIEGVKISLSQEAVSGITELDYGILHLNSTVEKLQQQLDVINQRWQTSRKLALASLQSGNKKTAMKHTKELKLAHVNREKYNALLSRVEEVLRVIGDAESSKMVSEAIHVGAQAIKEKRTSVEEVRLCLQELEETIDSHKLVESILESPLHAGIEDEEVENELKTLELEVGSDSSCVCISPVGVNDARERTTDERVTESLGDVLSNLSLLDDAPMQSPTLDFVSSTRTGGSKDFQLEAI